MQVPARGPGGAAADPGEDGGQDAEGDDHQRRGLSARGHERAGQAHRVQALLVGRHPSGGGEPQPVLAARAPELPGRDHGHAVLQRPGAHLRGLPDQRHAADVRPRQPARRRRRLQGGGHVPVGAQDLLQEVPVRAAAGGVAPGQVSARPLQRRGGHQDHREQAGRRGLPDLDAHVPPHDPEPQLLQAAGRVPPPPVRPPVRAGRDHAQRPRQLQVHQRRGRHRRGAHQPGHDRRLLLHQLPHHRAVQQDPHGQDQDPHPPRHHRQCRRVRGHSHPTRRGVLAQTDLLATALQARPQVQVQRPPCQGQCPPTGSLVALAALG